MANQLSRQPLKMKIQLDYKIIIEVKEGDKLKEKLEIFYREFTQAEKKKNEVIQKKFEKIFKKVQKIGNKQVTLNTKANLYELNKEFGRAIKTLTQRDALESEIDKLMKELKEIGGDDHLAFAEKSAKDRFEVLVSGPGKDKLIPYAEIKGYAELMRDLDLAKIELEKKQ